MTARGALGLERLEDDANGDLSSPREGLAVLDLTAQGFSGCSILVRLNLSESQPKTMGPIMPPILIAVIRMNGEPISSPYRLSVVTALPTTL